MKIKYVFFMVFFLLGSCIQKEKFIIEGIAPDYLNGQYAKLVTFSQNDSISIDSAKIVNGAFSFKGDVYTDRFSMLITEDGLDTVITAKLFLEPGSINVHLDTQSVIHGTSLNNIYQNYIDGQFEFEKLNKEIGMARLKNESVEELEEKRQEISLQYPNTIELIKDNISNPLGKEMLRENCWGMWHKDFLDIYSMADDTLKSEPLMTECFEHYKLLDEKEKLREKLRGTMFVDFLLYTPDGKQKKMSDYLKNNEYVLFDIWASWCVPCIRDFVYIREVYDTYKDKGVNVVGISLDTDKKAWINAIQTHGLSWPQLSPLIDNPELIEVNAIPGIPYTILVNRNGIIEEIGYPANIMLHIVNQIMKSD